MVIDFNGRTALVTGGAGGIGMACVKNLLASNAKVAVADVSDQALEAVQKELKGKGIFACYKLDISHVDAIAPAIEQIRKDMGEIEILVQTAGLLRGKPGLKLTGEDWDTMLNVNARGMFFDAAGSGSIYVPYRRGHRQLRVHGRYPGDAGVYGIGPLQRQQRSCGGHDHAGSHRVGQIWSAVQCPCPRRGVDQGYGKYGIS